jgi:hypothetical protein
MIEEWKREIRHQGTKIEEIQASRRSRKNRTIRFEISDYPVFPKLRVRLGFVI